MMYVHVCMCVCMCVHVCLLKNIYIHPSNCVMLFQINSVCVYVHVCVSTDYLVYMHDKLAYTASYNKQRD